MTDKETVGKRVMKAYSLLESATWELEEIKEDLCDNYCRWPELIRSMYKDPEEANNCLMSTKCETCPLNKL